MLILGLGHEAQNGKDTFADAVVATHSRNFKIEVISFADPLREEIAEESRAIWIEKHGLAPFQPQQAVRLLCEHYGVEFDENAPVDRRNPWGKQRKLQQWKGTEQRRTEDPDYWTKRADVKLIDAERRKVDAVILPDMRFWNEYSLIGSKPGGWRLKLRRIGYKTNVPKHISEFELADAPFDSQLHIKDGDLGLLKRLAPQIFKTLMNYVPLRKVTI